MVNASQKIVYKPLPKETISHMEKQREFVRKFVAKHFPNEKIHGNKKDFSLLQKIVDSKLIKKNDTWELQSLGIVFGDALLTNIEGLAWWEVTDEYGTDPVLRFKETTLQLTPLTMISKRVEDDEEINIEHIGNWLKDFVINKSHEYK